MANESALTDEQVKVLAAAICEHVRPIITTVYAGGNAGVWGPTATDPASVADRPVTLELLYGGRDQCEHGFPHGHRVRPTTGNAPCPFFRVKELDRREEVADADMRTPCPPSVRAEWEAARRSRESA